MRLPSLFLCSSIVVVACAAEKKTFPAAEVEARHAYAAEREEVMRTQGETVKMEAVGEGSTTLRVVLAMCEVAMDELADNSDQLDRLSRLGFEQVVCNNGTLDFPMKIGQPDPIARRRYFAAQQQAELRRIANSPNVRVSADGPDAMTIRVSMGGCTQLLAAQFAANEKARRRGFRELLCASGGQEFRASIAPWTGP